MDGLNETIREVNERVSFLESKRDVAITESRKIIRKTKQAIHAMHSRECYADYLEKLGVEVNGLVSELSDAPEILYSGVVQNAMGEYAEACILASAYADHKIPSFADLGITAQSWALGLADTVGEIRRMILVALVEDEKGRAKKLFETMEFIYTELMLFDTPDAIMPIRHKQDIARSVMEKTRTDIVNAIVVSRR